MDRDELKIHDKVLVSKKFEATVVNIGVNHAMVHLTKNGQYMMVKYHALEKLNG